MLLFVIGCILCVIILFGYAIMPNELERPKFTTTRNRRMDYERRMRAQAKRER